MLGGRDSGGSNASYDDMNQDQDSGQSEAPARQAAPATQAAKPAAGGSSFDEFDDDIPF